MHTFYKCFKLQSFIIIKIRFENHPWHLKRKSQFGACVEYKVPGLSYFKVSTLPEGSNLEKIYNLYLTWNKH